MQFAALPENEEEKFHYVWFSDEAQPELRG
jgi:hypothetical protein